MTPELTATDLQKLRPMQLAVVGMGAGLISLVAIALVIARQTTALAENARIWHFGLAIVTAVMIVSILAVRAWTASQIRGLASRAASGGGAPGNAAYAYGTGRLLAAGLAESIGLLGAVAFILTQEPLVLSSCALSMMLVLVHLPTAGGFQRLVQSAIVH